MLSYHRKTRASNFTTREKALLVALVRKYEDIEIKKTDKAGTIAKNKAWYHLTQDFNVSSAEGQRTQDTLQRCWNNLKKITRRAIAHMKTEKNKSGEGPLNISSLSSLEEQVFHIINTSKKGLSNNHNQGNNDDDEYDEDDSGVIEEESMSNSSTKDFMAINDTINSLPEEDCTSFSVRGGLSEAETNKEISAISVKVQDPLSVEQADVETSVVQENCENSSNWCEWIPLTERPSAGLLLQNTESSAQQVERSTLDSRRIDITEMMKQQMKEEIEFRREEAQHKRELFEIQKQQELLKLKILQKALQSSNVTINMFGSAIHTAEK